MTEASGGVRGIERCFADALALLVDHAGSRGVVQERDGLLVTAVGRGGEAFNTAWVADAPRDPPTAVAAALEALERSRQPFSIQVPRRLSDAIAPALSDRGLRVTSSVPGMVLRLPVTVPAPPGAITIVRVDDAATWRDHVAATAAGFGAPEHNDELAAALPLTLIDDPAVSMFNGYVDGGEGAVATGVAVTLDDVVGIYAITVAEYVRRRGFGAAMTWAAVAAGREAGAAIAALQATAMGAPVYEGMGFVTTVHHDRWSPRP